MSAANKRYPNSFSQTADHPSILHPRHIDADVSACADRAVNPSDGLFDDSAYPTATPNELLPPPDFCPFFTLIEDPDTGEHHHPSVHYIFSDDNPDFVTSTIVDGIDEEQADKASEQQPATNRERMILLDMAPDGKTVSEAQSLSAHWQILKTTVGQAPSWADDISRKDIPGLMLNIQGMESRKLKAEPNRRRMSHEDTMARVEAMIGGYTECLTTLEGLIKKDSLQEEVNEHGEAAKVEATIEEAQRDNE